MLSTLDILAILAYFAVMLAISLLASKKVKSAKDFASANKALGLVVTIGTLAGTAIGTASTMGLAGSTYTSGVSAYWYIISWSIGWAVLALVAKKVYATGATSVSDMFGIRFGKYSRMIAAIVSLMFGVAALSAQISGLGSMFAQLGADLGLDYTTTTILVTVLMIAMVFVGGLYAVAYTDTFNFFVLAVAFCLVLPVVVLATVGGLSGASVNLQSLPASHLNLVSGVSFMATLGTIIKYCFTASTTVAYVQRTLAAKDARTASRGHWGGIIAHAVVAFIIMLAALVFVPLLPGMENPDQLLPTIILEHFPVVLQGVAIAGMIAVIFSTASTWLQITGQVTGTDIYKLLRPQASDRSVLWVSRCATVCWGIIAVVGALFIPSVLSLFSYGSTVYGAGMFFPFMCLLFWKKVTGAGVNAGMLIGAVSAVLWAVFSPVKSIDAVLVGSVLSGVAVFAVSLATAKKKA